MGSYPWKLLPLRKERLEVRCEPISSLRDQAVHDMYALNARHFDATSPVLFEHDLKAKDFAFVIRNDASAIVGSQP
jgi:hypothetical protein